MGWLIFLSFVSFWIWCCVVGRKIYYRNALKERLSNKYGKYGNDDIDSIELNAVTIIGPVYLIVKGIGFLFESIEEQTQEKFERDYQKLCKERERK